MASSIPLLLLLLLLLPTTTTSGQLTIPLPITLPTPSSADTPTTPSAQNIRRMTRDFVRSHNEVRASLGEEPFTWDKGLARYARRWAGQRRGDCAMTHSMGPYGENMFWGSGWDWTAGDAVRSWAREHMYYNPEDNSCAPGKTCGHFTQIAWNGTARVGCARVECVEGGVIVVCVYDPPGNWLGERPFSVSTA